MLVAGTIALGAFHTVLIKASFGRFIMSCMLSYWLITHCKKLLSPAFTSPYVFLAKRLARSQLVFNRYNFGARLQLFAFDRCFWKVLLTVVAEACCFLVGRRWVFAFPATRARVSGHYRS